MSPNPTPWSPGQETPVWAVGRWDWRGGKFTRLDDSGNPTSVTLPGPPSADEVRRYFGPEAVWADYLKDQRVQIKHVDGSGVHARTSYVEPANGYRNSEGNTYRPNGDGTYTRIAGADGKPIAGAPVEAPWGYRADGTPVNKYGEAYTAPPQVDGQSINRVDPGSHTANGISTKVNPDGSYFEIDPKSRKVTYFDKDGKEITESDFRGRTGPAGTAVAGSSLPGLDLTGLPAESQAPIKALWDSIRTSLGTGSSLPSLLPTPMGPHLSTATGGAGFGGSNADGAALSAVSKAVAAAKVKELTELVEKEVGKAKTANQAARSQVTEIAARINALVQANQGSLDTPEGQQKLVGEIQTMITQAVSAVRTAETAASTSAGAVTGATGAGQGEGAKPGDPGKGGDEAKPDDPGTGTEKPQDPTKPSTPAAPTNPGTPSTPEAPITPATPSTPSVPATPSTPSAPSTTDSGAGAVAPAGTAPATPSTPARNTTGDNSNPFGLDSNPSTRSTQMEELAQKIASALGSNGLGSNNPLSQLGQLGQNNPFGQLGQLGQNNPFGQQNNPFGQNPYGQYGQNGQTPNPFGQTTNPAVQPNTGQPANPLVTPAGDTGGGATPAAAGDTGAGSGGGTGGGTGGGGTDAGTGGGSGAGSGSGDQGQGQSGADNGGGDHKPDGDKPADDKPGADKPGGTEVKTPDGKVVHAPDKRAADALTQAYNNPSTDGGTDPASKYYGGGNTRAGDPVDPADVKPGDVATFANTTAPVGSKPGLVVVDGKEVDQSSIPGFQGYNKPPSP